MAYRYRFWVMKRGKVLGSAKLFKSKRVALDAMARAALKYDATPGGVVIKPVWVKKGGAR